jgi:hypothetical protein
MALVALTIVLGLGAFAGVTTVRKFPQVSRWARDGIKPWACDACLSCWMSLALALAWAAILVPDWYRVAVAILAAPPGAGLCLILLRWYALVAEAPGPHA